MLSLTWAKDAAERAVRATAWSLISLWTAAGFNVLTVDWAAALGVAAGAGLLSLLASVVSTGISSPDDASLLPAPGRHEAKD